MLKQPDPTLHKTTRTEITSLFGDAKLVLDETPKALSPFGGLVVRERVRESKAAVGRKLIDVPGYTFRVWVTNRSEGALELWRDYNGRACVEQRIEELKHDPAADGFRLQPFYATESAFLAVLFTFNLEPLPAPDHARRALSTAGNLARGGAPVRGDAGRAGPRRGGQTLGGLGRPGQTQAAGDWWKAASPKLVPPEDRLPIGGGLI
jgi:hypothetical protein